MHFVLILAIGIGLGAGAMGGGLAQPLEAVGQRLAAVAFAVGFVVLFATVIATAIREQLVARFDQRAPILALYQRLQWIHTAVSLAIYAVIIHVIDWPTLVRVNWTLADWIAVDELLILAPFLAQTIGSWAAFYRVDRIVRIGLNTLQAPGPPLWTRRQYLSFHVRHYLVLVLVPATVFFAAGDVLEQFGPASLADNDAAHVAGLAGVAILVLVLPPPLIRVAWRAAPLPAGPLRRRLEADARRAGFRFTDILVWNTGGGIVNAAVTGVIAPLRYVLLSDGLCARLSEDEIAAVFGHEIGHVKHHHMLFYFFFVLGGGVVVSFAAQLVHALLTQVFHLDPGVVEHEVLHGAPFALVTIGAYFGLVFGFLSRRFERQADLYGCRLLAAALPSELPADPGRISPAAIHTFARALETVAWLNGIARHLRSWRHFSIARRVAFLEALAANPGLESRFQASLRRLKLSLVLSVSSIAVYLLASSVWLPANGG